MRRMRRQERAVTDRGEILEIIKRCPVMRLGLVDDGEAYIVPLNFGYTDENGQLTFYFHGAKVGRKIDLITQNGRAAFEMDGAHALIRHEKSCGYSYAYESVMGTGSVRLIDDPAEKQAGMDAIMRHASGEPGPFDYDPAALAPTAIIVLTVDALSAKRH